MLFWPNRRTLRRTHSEEIHRNAIQIAQDDEFNKINLTLPAFALRYERLRLAQPLARYCLGKPRPLPRFSEAQAELPVMVLVAGGVEQWG